MRIAKIEKMARAYADASLCIRALSTFPFLPLSQAVHSPSCENLLDPRLQFLSGPVVLLPDSSTSKNEPNLLSSLGDWQHTQV